MTETKLYAISDADAALLNSWVKYSPVLHPRTAASLNTALTPLDTDDAVERMARAILQNTYGGSVDILSHNAWDSAREDARAALEALTKENQT